jgi:sugar/nucleoside kinase (ribokinase family)
MDLVGIGNALLDVIAFVDEDFAPSIGIHNNSVVHMDRARLGNIVEGLPNAAVSAGGGAANTARAVAALGMKATFIGSVGDDELGQTYAANLEEAGVQVEVTTSPAQTGLYCALVRPDGGRTLLVSPAAALDIEFAPLPTAFLTAGSLFYAEGYLLRNRPFLMDCLRRAREAGMTVAFDLASRSLTSSQRDFLLEFLPRFCDLVFANEDEFVALAGFDIREGLDLLESWGIELVIKRAERGAIWAKGQTTIDSPVRSIQPVDETGAGDAFAAGFIYGKARGMPPERCLRIGNRIAEEALRVPALSLDAIRVKRAISSVVT